MATPADKLAQSLELLHKLQHKKGIAVIKAKDLSRTHKERLVARGFIQEVIKGWYISARPDAKEGESTSWYMAFWYFCSVYLKERFDENWSFSPEQSLLIHSGNYTVPKQLLVRSPKARNKVTNMPHGTSIFDIRGSLPDEEDVQVLEGLRVYSLSSALISCSPSYFSRNPFDVRIALTMIRDSSEILSHLLAGGHSTIAGRLAGAFRNMGRHRIADDILQAMKSAGYTVRESDPFHDKMSSLLEIRSTSPYVNRITMMWKHMRDAVINTFPESPGIPKDKNAYIKRMDEIYTTDAYHSLSIEGYGVTRELIDKVKRGMWNPDRNREDKNYINVLAARGYWQAFQAVKMSVKRILKGENPGHVADMDHGSWYRELFSPIVTAGILKSSDLAGYRNDQVYIKGSKHTPLNPAALRDAMPALLDLLKEEKEPCVRAVLGHFIFVYIHPYMDGNGRIGRFLMNVMLASGGYPWTVIPVESRNEYMNALEKASVDLDITPLSRFISTLVKG